jgi:hypothetical protein
MYYAWERKELHIKFQSENLKERGRSEYICSEETYIKMALKEAGCENLICEGNISTAAHS